MFPRQIIIVAAVVAVGVALAAIADPAWAQAVGAGNGANGFVQWMLGPQMLGALIGLFIALTGLVLMAGQHTWTGILFTVVGAAIVGSAVTIGNFFGGA
jgi:hypothetical protein